MKWSYVYDAAGLLVRSVESEYFGDDSPSEESELLYDPDGKIVQSSLYFDGHSEPTNKFTHRYDDDGYEAECKSFNEDGSLVRTDSYRYTLDSTDNWIRRTITLFRVGIRPLI